MGLGVLAALAVLGGGVADLSRQPAYRQITLGVIGREFFQIDGVRVNIGAELSLPALSKRVFILQFSKYRDYNSSTLDCRNLIGGKQFIGSLECAHISAWEYSNGRRCIASNFRKDNWSGFGWRKEYYGPMSDIVGRSLSVIYHRGSYLYPVGYIKAPAESREYTDVRPELASSRSARPPKLQASQQEQADSDNRNGVAAPAEKPSPDVDASAQRLAGTLTAAGIGLAVAAWLAGERHPRIAVALWCCGVLVFVGGLYGLSDTLCGSGARR